jgi:heat shock protein HslJ
MTRNIKLRTAFILFAVVLTMAVSAFAQSGNIGSVRWKLTQANGNAITNSLAYIQLNTSRTRFSGHSGCNQMSGPVTVRGRGIDFGRIGLTRRACKLMAGNVSEEEFVEALGRASRYNRNGGQLAFYDRRGRTILRFRADTKDDTVDASDGLGEYKWFLQSIGTRRTFAAIKGVFVSFDSANRGAGGDTGCNVFGGSYTAAKQTISITNIIATMRACEEGNKMQLEREFLDGLRNANRFAIRGNSLTLYRNNSLLLTLRGEPKAGS